MRPLAWLLLLVALVYQVVALPLYRIGGAAPDFVLLFVSYLALFEVPRRSIPAAFLCGLGVDALSADPWGCHAAGYALGVWILSWWHGEGLGEDPLPRSLLVLLAAAASSAARWGVLVAWTRSVSLVDPLAAGACVAYTGLLSLVVFGLLDPLRAALVSPIYRQLR